MKNFTWLLVLLLFAGTSLTFAQKSKTKGTRTLTLAIAQRILNKQINEGTADNILFTCRACYDPDDKSDNDNFPLVTTYSPALSQFLVRKGYIRVGNDGTEYFTAKAKQSPYFEAFGDGSGSLGGAGFRFSNFRSPKITVSKITNPKSVPIQYEAVPTDLTREFFRTNAIMKTTASFTFDDGKWSVCIACNGEDRSEVVVSQDRAATSVPETIMIVPVGENAPEAIIRVVSTTTIAAGKHRVTVVGGPCRSQGKTRFDYIIDTKERLTKGDLFFVVPVSDPVSGWALRRLNSREAARYESCHWR